MLWPARQQDNEFNTLPFAGFRERKGVFVCAAERSTGWNRTIRIVVKRPWQMTFLPRLSYIAQFRFSSIEVALFVCTNYPWGGFVNHVNETSSFFHPWQSCMTLDYFYGQAGELFSFYRIPKALFQEQRFQDLSIDAKTLYGILLDRMILSVKNEWFDKKAECSSSSRLRMSRGLCVAQTTKRPDCSGNLKNLVWLNEDVKGRESHVWCMWKTFRQNLQRKVSRIVTMTIQISKERTSCPVKGLSLTKWSWKP